jgi:hypothetical protein
MSEQTLVERLEARPGEDHTRGCQGREYTCSCGFNDATDALFTEAASELSRLSEALRKAEALKDCAPFLRDLAAFYRIEAADLVGGTHNRIIVEAEDCERWASVIAALSTPNPLKEPSE